MLTKTSRKFEIEDYSMSFEFCLRLFFGEEAYHTAGLERDDAIFRKYFRRVCKKIIRDLSKIDTAEEHKETLIFKANEVMNSLRHKGIPDRKIIVNLFAILGYILGYAGVTGNKYRNFFYTQSYNQRWLERIHEGIGWEKIDKDKQNLLAKKNKVILQLKKDGFSDFEISVIMNTTEYDIKKVNSEV